MIDSMSSMFVEAILYHTPIFGILVILLSVLSGLDTERGTKGNDEE